MINPKGILASAALAALLAAPAVALDISTDAMLGATPDDMTKVKVIEDSAFVGNEVRTKDQINIGLVESVYEGSDGGPVAVVALNTDIGAKSSVKSFSIPLDADSTADGALTLGWTEAELIIAIGAMTVPENAEGDSSDDGAGTDAEGSGG